MGYDSTPTTRFIYTCPHTGEKFEGSSMESAQALALKLSPNCAGALLPKTYSVLTGQQSSQTGSQPRMNANASGSIDYNLPDISDATYAAGWLGTYVGSMPGSVIAANPSLGIIQKYPVSQGTAEVFKLFPQLAPPVYGAPAAGSAISSNPSSRPGSANEPGYVQSTVNKLLGVTSAVGAQGGDSALGSITDKIKAAPIMLIAVIGIGLIVLFMLGKGVAGRAVS